MATNVTKAKTVKAVSVPAGIRWSQEDAQKALAKRAFIRVGGKNVTYRYISGALRSWNSDKQDERSTLFNLQYRITGTPESITEALTQGGLTQAQVTRALSDSISAENVQSHAVARLYSEELVALEELRKSTATTETTLSYTLADIISLGERVKDATIIKPSKTGGKSTPTAGTLRGPSLKDRLAGLGSDKVLDVSNMDRQTGKSVRSVARPKSSRGGKFLSQQLPIVSNNLDNFTAAIRLIHGTTSGHQAAVTEAEQFFSQVGGKPKKSKSPKPKKVKVAKKAPSPVPDAPRQRSPVVNCPVPRIASPVVTRGGISLPTIASLPRK